MIRTRTLQISIFPAAPAEYRFAVKPIRAHPYKLIGKLAVSCPDWIDWAKWFETTDRCVARTEVGPIIVSTVFLGLEHNFGGDGDPLLFETMIFGEREGSEWEESYTERASTWGQAEDAHAKAVAHAKHRLATATGEADEC